MNRTPSEYRKARLIPSIFIILMVAAIFVLRPAARLPHDYYIFYQSFGGDILVPFAFYFILDISAADWRLLRLWRIKFIIVFAGASTSELLQFFGIYAFGVTYDYWDFLMYFMGASLAVIIDKSLLKSILKEW